MRPGEPRSWRGPALCPGPSYPLLKRVLVTNMATDMARGQVFERRPNGRRPLQRDYPAVPDSVPHARTAIARYARDAGASDELVEDIRLASAEALTNVVGHA